jgi:hypothetical protein
MDNKTLKRRSRQGSLISALGFFVILIAFVYASVKLSGLNNEINQKTSELNRIDSILARKDSLILNQTNLIEHNRNLIDTLVTQINELTDNRIYPKAQAVAIPGVLDGNKRQIYDFTIWITSSQVNLNEIVKVTYEFRHDTFLLNTRESTNVSNGFLVSYRGWGCLAIVELSIQYANNTTEKIFFNMCQEIDWHNPANA